MGSASSHSPLTYLHRNFILTLYLILVINYFLTEQYLGPNYCFILRLPAKNYR